MAGYSLQYVYVNPDYSPDEEPYTGPIYFDPVKFMEHINEKLVEDIKEDFYGKILINNDFQEIDVLDTDFFIDKCITVEELKRIPIGARYLWIQGINYISYIVKHKLENVDFIKEN